MIVKKFYTAIGLMALLCLQAIAQNDHTTLLTINGKPVSVGEFMYSYNKNGSISGSVEQKTLREYVDMFVNYKLKVAAAEEARLDTVKAFKDEYLKYRDMQIADFLVDKAFIDSVAHAVYNRTVEGLAGKDMLHPAHILISVKSSATETEISAAKAKADSLHHALAQGADFATEAQSMSEDRRTASAGGQLPWIGPGMTMAEFEKAAYDLAVGEMSQPVRTPLGFHIIRMNGRKQLEPFDSLRAQIISGLKRQGIEEASAERRIEAMVKASRGKLTREEVLDSVLNAQVRVNPDLRYLVQEYYDGLLLYEISRRHVWDRMATDGEQMERLFKSQQKKYAWEEPRWRGFVIHMKSPKLAKKVKRVLRKYAEDDWRAALKREINVDSVIVRVQGPYVCKRGENAYVDYVEFDGEEPRALTGYPYHSVYGKLLKKPKHYTDVKPEVEADYQEILESEWVAELRNKYRFEVDESVLKQIEK